jgi:omega-amidase
MNIALIQTDLYWQNPIKNVENLIAKINAIAENTDLVVLPEMFTSGFSMNPTLFAETMEGKTITALKAIAKQKNMAITGSLAISENNNFYNRLVFIHPEGKIDYYDKKHLFALCGEHEVYSPGNSKAIVTYKNRKICLQVCYDLRFPVFARNTENYDIMIYVANWPVTRVNAWDTLLKARAIENQCFVVGVNRIGVDGNDLHYCGHSQIIDELGNYVIEPNANEATLNSNLNFENLYVTRKKLPFLEDRDDFKLV